MNRVRKPTAFSLMLVAAVILLAGALPALAMATGYASSQNVLLVPNDGYTSGAGEMPTTGPGFNAFTFTQADVAYDLIADPGAWTGFLSSYDTVAFIQYDNVLGQLTTSQVSALDAWISAGGKLIIHDSDATTPQDYSFLPYPFQAVSPGQTGDEGGVLTLVEQSTLGQNLNPVAPFYVDPADIVANTDGVGDANVLISQDPHWYGHLEATNTLGDTGWTQCYAAYNAGLMIYNGLDTDYIQDTLTSVGLSNLWLYELQQPWNPDGLPRDAPINGPRVAADHATVEVNEGATAGNTGTWSDPSLLAVTLSASVGTVVENANGTWSWSMATTDGPANTQKVTITATDANSISAKADFALTVDNVAPTVTVAASPPVAAGTTYAANGSFSDPGADSPWTATVSYGDVSSTTALPLHADKTFALSHVFAAAGTYVITVQVTDKDHASGSTTVSQVVTVPPKPHLTKLSPKRGHRRKTVTITGTNLGATQGTSIVKFGAKACTKYLSWTATKIRCKVPARAKFGKVRVVVTTAGGASNRLRFKVQR